MSPSLSFATKINMLAQPVLIATVAVLICALFSHLPTGIRMWEATLLCDLWMKSGLFYLLSSRDYNYGITADGVKVDLLNHPEYLQWNAALAFKLLSGCGWSQGKRSNLQPMMCLWVAGSSNLQTDDMTIFSHCQYYLELICVGGQFSKHNLDSAEQEPFKSSSKSASS